MIRRAAAKTSTTASSQLVIGVATAFVFLAAVLGLVVDGQGAPPDPFGATWSLRGAVDDLSGPSATSHRV